MRAYPRSLLLLLAVLLTAGAVSAQQQPQGWLGAEFRDLTREEAREFGWEAPRGAKVVRPAQDSPAGAAGLEPGDVIATLDGIEVQNEKALTPALKDKAAGTPVELRVMRAGKERTVSVTLGTRPEVLVLNDRVIELLRAGKHNEALSIAQRALALGEQQLGPEHEYVGEVLSSLAVLHDRQNRYADAEPFYGRAVTILEKTRGAEDAGVGRALAYQAMLYTNLNRPADAEPLYQRSAAILEKALGPEHPHAVSSLQTLALAYRRQGRPDDAIHAYQRALAIREKALGPDHLEVAAMLVNVAEQQNTQPPPRPTRSFSARLPSGRRSTEPSIPTPPRR